MCADGVVLCHGKGCQVTFTNVTFERCTLVVLEGAAATLRSCNFSNSTRQEGVSIYASGSGTAVNVRGGSIVGGAQGASIAGGAAFKAAFLTVSKVRNDSFSPYKTECQKPGRSLQQQEAHICDSKGTAVFSCLASIHAL